MGCTVLLMCVLLFEMLKKRQLLLLLCVLSTSYIYRARCSLLRRHGEWNFNYCEFMYNAFLFVCLFSIENVEDYL